MDDTGTLIGVGGSAGSIDPLLELLGGFPRDLPGSVLVVIHLPPTGVSRLPQIARRATMLQVADVRAEGPLEPGVVYIAPPDYHLLVNADGDRYRLDLGPRENGARPAVDALFRSIAAAGGPRGAGIVLSGMMDDGAAGLRAIGEAGGATFVQDPEEATNPAMPASARDHTPGARVLPVAQVAGAVTRHVGQGLRAAPPRASRAGDLTGAPTLPPDSPDRPLVCPDCGGPLTATDDGHGTHVSFRCVMGHAYSGGSLEAAQADIVERALWTACRALEDRAALNQRLADRAGASSVARGIRRRGRDASHAADVIRSMLYRGGIARIDVAGAAPAVPERPPGGELEEAR